MRHIVSIRFYYAVLAVMCISMAIACTCEDLTPDFPELAPLPDLVPTAIELVGNTCPNGQGTCILTVGISIANLGQVDSGPFSIRVLFDPDQSNIVEVPVGSIPGSSDSVSSIIIEVSSMPGDNCFDSDCRVTVIVDSKLEITESNENNNSTFAVFAG